MKQLRTLQQCAEQNLMAVIVYRKPGESWRTERLVEPYQLTYSGPNLIVLTWQFDPELDHPGWRNFRVDRIQTAANSGKRFRPRIPVTLHTGEVTQFEMRDNKELEQQMLASGQLQVHELTPPPSLQQQYAQALENALYDGIVSETESKRLMKLQKKLDAQQMKSTHAQVYANTINEITIDGRVSDEEESLLENMRVFLTGLGWCP